MARAKQVAQEGLVNWDMKQLNIGNDRLAKLMFLEQQKSSQKEADRRAAARAKVKTELREAKRARMGAAEEKREYWGKRMGMQPAKDDPRRNLLNMRSIEQVALDKARREHLSRRLRIRIMLLHCKARLPQLPKKRRVKRLHQNRIRNQRMLRDAGTREGRPDRRSFEKVATGDTFPGRTAVGAMLVLAACLGCAACLVHASPTAQALGFTSVAWLKDPTLITALSVGLLVIVGLVRKMVS